MAYELCIMCVGSGRIDDPARSVCPACGGSGQATVKPSAPSPVPDNG